MNLFTALMPKRRSRRSDKPLTALGARIQKALDRTGMSQGHVEKIAGLGDASLSQTMTVERPNIALKTLLGLSNALGVRLEWLATGSGPMLDSDAEVVIELDPRYPNRARAIAKARREGYSEAAIATVQDPSFKLANDLPETEWSAEIHSAEQRLKKFGTAAAPSQVDSRDDDARTLAQRVQDVKDERGKGKQPSPKR